MGHTYRSLDPIWSQTDNLFKKLPIHQELYAVVWRGSWFKKKIGDELRQEMSKSGLFLCFPEGFEH